jgi:hypothetical protein
MHTLPTHLPIVMRQVVFRREYFKDATDATRLINTTVQMGRVALAGPS